MTLAASYGYRDVVGGLPSWRLTVRQACDLELISCGAFAPLRTFMGRDDFESVCLRMRLADGTLWPIPVMLDVPESVVAAADRAGGLVLSDDRGVALARLSITEAWRPDHESEARAVLGTTDTAHPGVRYLVQETHPWYVTGELSVLHVREHPELSLPVHSPAEVRAEIQRRGWARVVAFNTRNPMHQAHRELVLRAAASEDAGLLVHPVVGMTRPGDVPAPVRVRCYQAVMRTLPPSTAMLSLLPLAMRMGGPREALWHAIIRRNYGATAFIVGRDHAAPGVDSLGRPFYGTYDAQRLVGRHADEIGIRMVPARQIVYVEGLGHIPDNEVPAGRVAMSVSGTRVRRHLADGTDIPPWLVAPDVVTELRRAQRENREEVAS
jgi:sulfate adenylyltransferase